jgi:hypothetical protein
MISENVLQKQIRITPEATAQERVGLDQRTKQELKSSIALDVTSYSPARVGRRFGVKYYYQFQVLKLSQAKSNVHSLLDSCLVYSSTLEMEAVYSFETSVTVC